MNLYEYEAKRIFADFGITVPPSARITAAEELKKVDLGYPLTLKCQVLAGGRGKAGGIKFAPNLAEGEKIAKDLLNLEIKGCKTESLLCEPKVAIARELYMAVTLDRARGCAVFLAASEGGIEIESNESVITVPIPTPFRSYVARDLAKQMGFTGPLFNKIADVAAKLYKVFEQLDLDLAEINPLVITKDDQVLALDGKIIVNDDALGRQKMFAGWQERHLTDVTVREGKAKLQGLNLVELEGNIGILCNGAGLTMATMDMVKKFGGSPANFLDVGGGSDEEKTLFALDIVNENPQVEVILLNILGGITACDQVAGALVEFRKRNPKRKMAVRLRGNNQEVAAKMLADSGLKLIPDLESAVNDAIAQAK